MPPADCANALLVDAFGRVHDLVHEVVADLGPKDLAWRPAPDANSIAWLVWHLGRVEDDHLSGISGSEQRWLSDGWVDRFALPIDPRDIGYGQTAEQARLIRVESGGLLTGYYDAVHSATVEIIRSMSEADYGRIVDRRWTPPVTAAVRMVSVVNDITQHIGQAAYVRGLLPSRTP